MRIFFEKDSITVEGTKQAFPSRSLEAEISANYIIVRLLDESTKIVQAPWQRIFDKAGNGFNTQQEAKDYLDDVFSQSIANSVESRLNVIEDSIDGEVAGADPLSYYILAKNT